MLLLRPVFSRLKRALPESVSLRILNCDYDMLPLVVPTGVDIIFTYSALRIDAESTRLLDEMFVPVASPAFRRRFERVLGGHPRHWTGVPRLALASRDQGWATWGDWFAAHDSAPPQAPVETFENYIPLLDAAVDGDGIAIGWKGFVRSYFETGRLVPIREEWTASHVALHAVLTSHGGRNPNAKSCLMELASLKEDLAGGRELPVFKISG